MMLFERALLAAWQWFVNFKGGGAYAHHAPTM
jgi:hypothetical protein